MYKKPVLYATALLGAALLGFAAIMPVGCTAGGSRSQSGVPALGAVGLPEDASPVAAAGARLWAQNCVRCHNIRTPASYSDDHWEVTMLHMRIQASLTVQEHDAILQFLKAAN